MEFGVFTFIIPDTIFNSMKKYMDYELEPNVKMIETAFVASKKQQACWCCLRLAKAHHAARTNKRRGATGFSSAGRPR